MPVLFEYRCPVHGRFDSFERGDAIKHDCGERSLRVWRLRIAAESARHRGRWDPVVGEYVESERQWRSLLARGQEEQSKKLGMDVKLATVDARDSEGLAELHGWSVTDREADLEGTRKVAWEKKNA